MNSGSSSLVSVKSLQFGKAGMDTRSIQIHNNQIEVTGGRKIRHDGGGGQQQRNNQIVNRRVGRKIVEAVDGKKGVSSGDDHRGQQRE